MWWDTSEADSSVEPGAWARTAAPKVSAPVNAVAYRQEPSPQRGEECSVCTRCTTAEADRKCTPRPRARRESRGDSGRRAA